MLSVEGPDVEVLDAICPIYEVQGRTLAQGAAQETAGVAARALRIPLEQFRLRVGGQLGESNQVSQFDPRLRPLWFPCHLAMLSQCARGVVLVGGLHVDRIEQQPARTDWASAAQRACRHDGVALDQRQKSVGSG